MNTNPQHHVILGNCIAAITAAETLRRHAPRDKITILSDEDVPSYSRCLITYYLAGDVTRKHLLSHTEKWYNDRAIDLHLKTKATRVDTTARRVKTNRRKSFTYDKLLVATGARPIFFPTIPYDPDGIIGMRTYQDSSTLIKWSAPGKRALVVGAGFVGLKSAYGLIKRGVKVHVVELLPTVLGRMADEEASRRIVEKFNNHELVDVTLNASVLKAEFDGNHYRAHLSTGEELIVDFIVMSVGVKPNVEMLDDTDIKINRGIVVDTAQRTTNSDVFAAGDVCLSPDLLTGQLINNAIWPVAAAQGRVAAMNMLGFKAQYSGTIVQNSVDFFGQWITALGDVQAAGKGVDYKMYSTEKVYQKLIFKDGILVGFMATGNVDYAGVIQALIKERATWNQITDNKYARLIPVVCAHT
jgi:NAD(P)H-nitrite reductase large subunit